MPSDIPRHPSLAGAVDLSTLASKSAQQPDTAAVDDVVQEELPQEFTVSVAGVDGKVTVLLGFSHLRWQFTPDLADDLAQTLLAASRQARQLDPNGVPTAARRPA